MSEKGKMGMRNWRPPKAPSRRCRHHPRPHKRFNFSDERKPKLSGVGLEPDHEV